MYGLEKQKKGKSQEEFFFDIERDLQDPKKQRPLVDKINGKIQKIKGMMREGKDKVLFDQLGSLLHGYTSLLKVFAKFLVTHTSSSVPPKKSGR